MSLNGTAIVRQSPPRDIAARLDPGPPVPGVNCHIVIDGVGYIMADLAAYTQESGRAVINEQLAPYFGDPQNALDTLSSDMTMLLPIGQGDFSDGMGFTDLEKNPKGFDRAENLIVTPQGTLYNGPQVVLETFTGNPNPTDSRGYTEGYFGGTVAQAGARNYFGIGGYLYSKSSSQWNPIPCRFPVTSIYGYSGRIVVGYSINGGDLFYNDAPIQAMFNIHKSGTVNGRPYILSRDGRIYGAYLNAPNGPIAINDETGADVTLAQWAYALRYGIKLPDNSFVWSGLGALSFATKLPNREIVLSLDAIGYRGGPVYRQLYRSTSNDLTNLYLLADETVLGMNTIRYVDTTTDATLVSKPAYDFNYQNSTGMVILEAGTNVRNMQFPDTTPVWLAENTVSPYTGDFINSTATFHDQQGNEAFFIGTSSGAFIWDGQGQDFQTVANTYYHALNYKYTAVNHGYVYFTMKGIYVYAWNPQTQVQIQGPWLSHFSVISEIRLANVAQYVAIAATGTLKENGVRACIVYFFDGSRFVWSYRWNGARSDYLDVTPILGQSRSTNNFCFYKGLDTGVNVDDVSPVPSNVQTANVMFKSAVSDGDLPRLRKQVHAVMVRYLRLESPNYVNTQLALQANVGDTQIMVVDPTGLAIGDWIRIDHPSIELKEFRKITAISGNMLTLIHPTGPSPLMFQHLNGSKVQKSVVTTTLRNVFTDALPVGDYEVGGPCDPGELFAYCRLPWPVYAYIDGVTVTYSTGTKMELAGWSMLTGLNPQWNGLGDISIRLQD